MVSIASLGSHSALEVSHGAAKHGIKTIVFCERGRDKQYNYYLKTKRKHSTVGIIDTLVRMDKFADIIRKDNIDFMLQNDTVFVPNRSFSVYVGYDAIENRFPVPIFGNRKMLRAEERDAKPNQYDLLGKANVKYPLSFKPEEIDRPVIVKVNERQRKYERAFFIAMDGKDYELKSEEMIRKGAISEEALATARIEELIIGPQFNFNFFYSPIEESLELIGIDTRRQANVDGFAKLPYWLQPKIDFKTIEVGHIACTLRESLLSKVYDVGEKILSASQEMFGRGIIGPFAIQSMIIADKEKEDIVVFDLSFRMPGSPGIKYTPYSEFLYINSISMGERIAIEILNAEKDNALKDVTS